MKAIELIRTAMQMSHQAVLQLAEDMRDAPLTSPTPRGGNHPLWVLGHLTYGEGNVPRIVGAEPNPLRKGAPVFARGTHPRSDASAYPPFEELLRTYRDLRARNL